MEAATIRGIIQQAGLLIDFAVLVLAGAALLVFFWGLVKFIYKAGSGDEKAEEEGKNIMTWGLIALFVMVSIWGIIGFLQRDLGLPQTAEEENNPQSVPILPPENIPINTKVPGKL